MHNEPRRPRSFLFLSISHTPIFKFILFIQSKIYTRNKNIEWDRVKKRIPILFFILKIVDSCDRFISLCILRLVWHIFQPQWNHAMIEFVYARKRILRNINILSKCIDVTMILMESPSIKGNLKLSWPNKLFEWI